MSKIVATRWSCARAISNGFSRRCEIGASTAVTVSSFSRANRPDSEYPRRVYVRSSEDESDLSTRPDASVYGGGDDADDVRAGREAASGGVPSREPERDSAGQDVAQARQQAERLAVRAEQLDVETRDRTDVGSCTSRRGRGRRSRSAPPAACRTARTSAARATPHRAGRRRPPGRSPTARGSPSRRARGRRRRLPSARRARARARPRSRPGARPRARERARSVRAPRRDPVGAPPASPADRGSRGSSA